MKKAVCIALLLLFVGGAGAGARTQDDSTIAEIRVHGIDAEYHQKVIDATGLNIGDTVSASDLIPIESALMDTGLFHSVSVYLRYMNVNAPVKAVVVIDGVPSRSIFNRILLRPEIEPSSEFGFSAGASLTLFNLLSSESALTVPVVFGGLEQYGVVYRQYFSGAVVKRLTLSGLFREEENPHFEVKDERKAFDIVVAGQWGSLFIEAFAGFQDVTFEQFEDSFSSFGLRASVDTRSDLFLPGNALYLQASVQRRFFDQSTDSIYYSFSGSGYISVPGTRLILVGNLRWEEASETLPDYLRNWLGGFSRLRGLEEGRGIGDNLFISTAELRVPLSSSTSAMVYGVHGFYNSGAVYNVDTSLGDVEFTDGYGLGMFFSLEDAGITVDIGSSPDEEDLVVHVGGRFRF